MAKSSDDSSELDRVEYSETTLAKAAARKGWQTRLEQIWTCHKLNGKLTDATSGLETLGCDWIAVIHADGNSLGEIFLNFDKHVPSSGKGYSR
ncbi:MAG: hypothetical protein KatS3mg110_0501 [Pirellulaceae bacterium]|nr:MAG: hypothetical protein KatS3mg110_0501 [Pirellulaceae bacterium]